MTSDSKFVYYLFIGIAITALIIALLYFIFNDGIFADENFNRGEVIDQISYSYNFDKTSDDEEILISKYKKDNSYDFYLEINNKPRQYLLLEGFESDVTFCEQEILEIDSDNCAVCVTGFVGAHSKNLQLIKYNNYQLSFYQFTKEGVSTNNIYSDSPNFGFYDFTSDSKLDLIIDYRNYDKNPLEDIERMYYYFNTDNGFIYDGFEEINQSSSIINGQGQIN